MHITIVPQNVLQFDRLMAFLEKDHEAYVTDLAEKRRVEKERNELLLNVAKQAISILTRASRM